MTTPYFICEICNERVISWKVPINSKEILPAHVAAYQHMASDGIIIVFKKLSFPLVLNEKEIICTWCGATAQTIGGPWHAMEYEVPNSSYTIRFISSAGGYYSIAFYTTGSYESGYATRWCKGAIDIAGLPVNMRAALMDMVLPDNDEHSLKLMEAAKIALNAS